MPVENSQPLAGELVASSAPLVLAQATPGAFMLARMPQEEFAQHLEMMRVARARVREIQRSLMEEGTHYGRVPGVDKPFLHQPGAEVLAQPLHLVPEYLGTMEWGDGLTRPVLTMMTECRLHYGTLDGPVVGTGRGAATSWERKHRYRQADKSCPDCGKVGTIRKGKADKGGGWYCWSKVGGCGSQFRDKEPRIVEQVAGMVENPDQADLLQTIQSIADKRAFVKAVRTTTATSDLFTQDEDLVRGTEEPTVDGAAGAARGSRAATGSPNPEAPLLPTWREAWDKVSADFRGLPQETPTLGPVSVAAVMEGLGRSGWSDGEIRTVLSAELGIEPAGLPTDGTNPPVLRKVQKAFRVYARADVGAEDRARYGWGEPPPWVQAAFPDDFSKGGAARHEEEPPFGDDEPGAGTEAGLGDGARAMADLGRLADEEETFPELADDAWKIIRTAMDKVAAAHPEALVPMTPDDRMDLFRPGNNGGRSSGDVDGLTKYWLGVRVEKLPGLVYAPVKRLLQTFPPSGPGREKILGDLPLPGEKWKPADLASLAERCVADGLIREDEVRHSGEKGRVTRDDLEQALALVRDRALMEAGRGGVR